MSKVKDLDLSLTSEDLGQVGGEEQEAEQSIEDFLAVMDANERGYYVNVVQPNQAALDIIAGLKDIIETSYTPSSTSGGSVAVNTYDDVVVKAAQVKILAAIKSLKLEAK
jgi:hypothetical protein